MIFSTSTILLGLFGTICAFNTPPFDNNVEFGAGKSNIRQMLGQAVSGATKDLNGIFAYQNANALPKNSLTRSMLKMKNMSGRK